MKEKLLVIVGPTAVGKTDISIQLARQFNGEIVSGDSMQIYRGLNIGTAKITEQEMQHIPHHMIDIKEPHESFSVSEFQREARNIISTINQRARLPILVGGTGLYVHAITHDYQFTNIESDEMFREEMESFADRYGNVALHEKLHKLDPESYTSIHPNNRRRVIRALEVYELTGKPFSTFQKREEQSIYDAVFIGLTMEREVLYERINTRIDMMIEKGLVTEALNLYKKNLIQSQASQAIGYKELFLYFDGTLSKEAAIELLKRNSRRYAKRQYTWFKNKMNITWFDMTHNQEKKKWEIIQYVAGKFSCIEKQ